MTDQSVHYSSASGRWNTPPHILDLVVEAMGGIDLDPCSNSDGPPNVPAARHFTEADDGLAHAWYGRAFINSPYGRVIGQWTDKAVSELLDHRLERGILLVPSRTDTKWYSRLDTYIRCNIRGRLKFGDSPNSAPFPSALVCICHLDDTVFERRFVEVFSPVGSCFRIVLP